MKKNLLLAIIILISLIVIGLAINKYNNRPYMTLIVKYDQVPPVIEGLIRGKVDAYYRGLHVGNVSKIDLSKDQKHIEFHLDIIYKNLKLPKNVSISPESEDLYGSRHLLIVYPDKPSNELLSDGDIVHGNRAILRIDKYLVKEMTSGRLNTLINNLLFLTNYLSGSLTGPKQIASKEEIRKLISELPQDINNIMKDLNEVNANIPQTNININQASSNIVNASNEISQASSNISQATNGINSATNEIATANTRILAVNKDIKQVNEIIPQITKELKTTNSILDSTNSNLSEVNSKIPKIPPIPPTLFDNANKLLIKANCMSDELAKSLSKRFLIFRFMFGSPASSLKNCAQNKDNNCNPCNCPAK